MPFNLFRKKKTEIVAAANTPPQQEQAQSQPEPETPQPQEPIAAPVAEEPAPEPAVTEPAPEQPLPQPEAEAQPVEQPPQETQPSEPPSKTYLKAMPLRELADIENVKNEVQNGNIIILKVTPLAQKSIDDVKTAVNDLYQFAENIGGDIARLGEERVVICPKTVRIWREKTPKPASDAPVPTAA